MHSMQHRWVQHRQQKYFFCFREDLIEERPERMLGDFKSEL
jgi:hypothetical protein